MQKVNRDFTSGIKWFFIFFFSVIGYKLKPQVLIVTIAICLVDMVSFIGVKIEKRKLNRFLASVTGVGMGVLAALAAYYGALGSLNIQLDTEKAFGYMHYMMMGINPDAKGVWAKEDVEFSAGFETIKERTHGNFERYKERLAAMGIRGVLRQISYKTLTNYNDGTFCWGG